MIDDIDLAGLLKRLRSKVAERPELMKEVLTMIADACVAPAGSHSDPLEIARTILELAYPERLGPLIVSLTCRRCGEFLLEEDQKLGVCTDCRIKSPQ